MGYGAPIASTGWQLDPSWKGGFVPSPGMKLTQEQIDGMNAVLQHVLQTSNPPNPTAPLTPSYTPPLTRGVPVAGGGPTIHGVQVPQTGGNTPALSLNDPDIAGIISKIFGQSKQIAGLNSEQPIATTKDPNTVADINQLSTDYKNTQNNVATSLTEYTKQLLGQRPQAQANVEQENAAVGDFYNGNVQKILDHLLEQDRIRSAGDVNRAIGRAKVSNAGYRMNYGNSSYADKALADTAGRFASENAARRAGTQRDNLLYVLGNKTGLMGRRNSNLQTLLDREYDPVLKYQQAQANDSTLLGSLANLRSGNTIYTRPEDALVSRQNEIDSLLNLDRVKGAYAI
jgi:hypothetical protein